MFVSNARRLVVVPAAAAIVLAFSASPSFASNTSCNGVESTNVSGNLVVPSGATCTVLAVNVGGSITVERDGTLIDKGANVAGAIRATSAKGIGVGGTSSGPGTVGQGISISGTTGAGPGTVDVGSNYICNTHVGGSVSVTGTVSGAGEWIIGDRDEDCSHGADQIAQSLSATDNKVRVDISDNEGRTFPYSVGIGQSLRVTGNSVVSSAPFSPVVESNFIAQSALCQAGTTMDGDGSPNIVEQGNHGCP